MTRNARVLTALAALLMFGAFAFPLWHIRLIAPQYPEGLGLLIHINTVRGVSPTDLNNINSLNHYIGMKAIDPDAIPVLRIMPWVLGVLATAGLAVAAAGRRRLLILWMSGFLALAASGMVEFWKWEHDYGHNLDLENAIIKVPGMTYQPPLIGSKQLLNFTAISLPATGAILIGLAFLLGVVAIVVSVRAARAARTATGSPLADGEPAALACDRLEPVGGR